jgi:hypothetical protein
MRRLLHNIFRLVLVIIPVLLALGQARGQADTVCAGETSVWVVEEFPGVNYTWELYKDVTGINFATDAGNCPSSEAYFAGGVSSGDSVNVICVTPGTYFICVKANSICPAGNLRVGKIVVMPCLSYAVFLEPVPACQGDTALMTILVSGAPGPWVVTFSDGVTFWTIDVPVSPYTFQLIPTPALQGSYTYWITSVTNIYGLTNDTPSDPVILLIKPKPVTSPIFRY